MRGPKAGEPSEPQREMERIVSMYGSIVRFDGPTIPLNLLSSLFRTGSVPDEAWLKGLADSPRFRDAPYLPPWYVLNDIWELSEESVARETKRTRELFRAQDIRKAGELRQYAGILLFREKLGDRTMADGQTAKAFLGSYLDGLHASDIQIEHELDSIPNDRHSSYGYVPLGASTHPRDYAVLAAMIEEARSDALRHEFAEVRQRWMDVLGSTTRRHATTAMHDDALLRTFSSQPCFDGADAHQIADFILRNGQFDHDALKMLVERWTHWGDEIREAERPFATELLDTLRSRTAQAVPPLRQFWSEQVERQLVPIVTPP